MEHMEQFIYFRRELMKLIDNAEQITSICTLYEKALLHTENERKRKQKMGIEKAKAKGVRMGRPKLEEPEDFNQILLAWERKEISAPEAAKLCKMGTSTFYRRIRSVMDRKGGDVDVEKV